VRPDDDLAGCRSAHERVAATLDAVDAATLARDSRLPGWTVAHVVAHLARNADSHTRLFEAAARGEVTEQYPGGPAERQAGIEEGARQGRDALVADALAATARLEAAWTGLSREAWATGRARLASGAEITLPDVVFRRWREVEVHHADLGLGFTFDDWSSGYVRKELARQVMAWRSRRAMGLTELPAEALALRPSLRLAWLLGRLEVPGLPAPGSWQ
jgi:maleylpyruvate isomerase